MTKWTYETQSKRLENSARASASNVSSSNGTCSLSNELTNSKTRAMASAFNWELIVSNALGSAGAGILSRFLTHPLDTAKARLQADGLKYKGPFDVLRKTYVGEG